MVESVAGPIIELWIGGGAVLGAQIGVRMGVRTSTGILKLLFVVISFGAGLSLLM